MIKLISKHQVTICIAAILLFSILFAFFGVYDNRNMSLPIRIVYWASLISTGTVAGIFSLPIVLTGRLKHAHILSKIFVQSALAALPVPIVIAAYSGGLSGSWPLLNWPTQYFSALVVSILIHSCMYMLFVTLGWIPDSKSTSK